MTNDSMQQIIQRVLDSATTKAIAEGWTAETIAQALREAEYDPERPGKAELALEMIYDKWENGTPCFEDPEECSGSLGNAFKLSYEEENQILELIGGRSPRKREAGFEKGEGSCQSG